MDYFNRAKFFRTKKRLGQNFLIDGTAIADIIKEANISPDDTVIEIGPGVGFVTEQLVKKAKKVIAIELDEEAIKELEKLNAPNLQIIHNDVLKTDLVPDLNQINNANKATVGTFFSVRYPKKSMRSFGVFISKIDWSKSASLKRLFLPLQCLGEDKSSEN